MGAGGGRSIYNTLFCSTLQLSTFTHESNQTSYRVGVTGRQGGREGCETWHLISRGYNYMVLCTLNIFPYKAKNSNVAAQQIINRPIKYPPHYYYPTRGIPHLIDCMWRRPISKW
jgi:hypothetical protein